MHIENVNRTGGLAYGRFYQACAWLPATHIGETIAKCYIIKTKDTDTETFYKAALGGVRANVAFKPGTVLAGAQSLSCEGYGPGEGKHVYKGH